MSVHDRHGRVSLSNRGHSALATRSCGEIYVIVGKLTDEFLLEGSCEEVRAFTDLLQKRFKVRENPIDEKLLLNGCKIEQGSNRTVTMSMKRYLEQLTPIDMSRSRQKMRTHTATDKEVKQYRSLVSMCPRASTEAIYLN